MSDKKAILSCLCEYMSSPTGIDCPHPRFSWAIKGAYGRQQSYRILVSETEDMNLPIWDSRYCEGTEQSAVYDGMPLNSGRTYYYKVVVVTVRKEILSSEIDTFSTGILEKISWDENWIGGAGVRNHSYLIRFPFIAKESLKAAAAFVVSPNYCLVTCNGSVCRDIRLGAPTEFSKTLLYETFPLRLHEGENVLGIEIGNGWFAMELAERGIAKNEHICAVKIRLEYDNGVVEWIESSPENCYCTADAPSVCNSIYTGDHLDLNRVKTGYDLPGYVMRPEDGWQHVFQQDSPGGEIVSHRMEPIRICAKREPVQIWKMEDGSLTVDFGQNFAGWVRLQAAGRKRQQIEVKYAELVNEDHTINDSSYNGIHITDTFVLAGKRAEILEPRFSYRGFRYANIRMMDGEDVSAIVTAIIGCVVHTDVKSIGSFHSDMELLNHFYQCVQWTEKSNLHGIPSDCPQRAERVGWLNDMTVRNECALYNYRLPMLYRKWTKDIRDCQGKTSGAITDTAPFFRMGQKPADPVSTSFLLVPWNTYCFYGDRFIIEENYESCKRWVRYLKRHSDNYIVRFSPMGDWASPKEWCDNGSIGAGAVSKITPTRFMATGYYYYNYILLAKMAHVLELEEEEKRFLSEAGLVRKAFLKEYYHPEEGYFCTNSQACNAFPLYLGILDNESDRKKVLMHLIEDIKAKDYHLTTGNLCSKYVVEVLFQNGCSDLAYRILTQDTYPSWGYMLQNDATTMWERWEKVNTFHGKSNMASYNHAMTGAVAVCFQKYLAGIRVDESAPGFRHALIRPLPPNAVGHVEGSLETISGKYSCSWVKKEGRLSVTVEIPFGCSAQVDLPIRNTGVNWSGHKELRNAHVESISEGKFLRVELQSGVHTFEEESVGG